MTNTDFQIDHVYGIHYHQNLPPRSMQRRQHPWKWTNKQVLERQFKRIVELIVLLVGAREAHANAVIHDRVPSKTPARCCDCGDSEVCKLRYRVESWRCVRCDMSLAQIWCALHLRDR